jgi:hypothetical protein
MPRNPQIAARDKIERKRKAWENAKALVVKCRGELDAAIVDGVAVGMTRGYIGSMLNVSGQAIGNIAGVPPGKNVVTGKVGAKKAAKKLTPAPRKKAKNYNGSSRPTKATK